MCLISCKNNHSMIYYFITVVLHIYDCIYYKFKWSTFIYILRYTLLLTWSALRYFFSVTLLYLWSHKNMDFILIPNKKIFRTIFAKKEVYFRFLAIHFRFLRQDCGSGSALFWVAGFGSAIGWKAGSEAVSGSGPAFKWKVWHRFV